MQLLYSNNGLSFRDATPVVHDPRDYEYAPEDLFYADSDYEYAPEDMAYLPEDLNEDGTPKDGAVLQPRPGAVKRVKDGAVPAPRIGAVMHLKRGLLQSEPISALPDEVGFSKAPTEEELIAAFPGRTAALAAQAKKDANQPALKELDELDKFLPRAIEDQWVATSFDTTLLPKAQQDRLARKIALRSQLQ